MTAKADVDVTELWREFKEGPTTPLRNRLVERYFGAFLDEIVRNGGDVNETAGDGLMVIFQDPDPRRHAHAAVTTALAFPATMTVPV